MLKNTLLAAILAAAASAANALPLIDFTGIAAGAQVLDYYNGGTDSTGASGTNYGVRFTGGTIVYDEFGPRLEGAPTITFNPGIVPLNEFGFFYIGFLANVYAFDGGFARLRGGGEGDDIYFNGYANPNCQNITPRQCFERGFTYASPATMVALLTSSMGGADTLYFPSGSAIDNIEFGGTGRPAIRIGTPGVFADVPEPASIALLGLGLVGLLASRRRSSV